MERNVDDTFDIQRTEHKENFLQHINSINQAIRFIEEGTQPDGSMPFLDTIITPEQNRTLSISVYRKHTQRNQYLQWDSHHHIATTYSVIGTLSHTAKSICSTLELLRREQQYLREVLIRSDHPIWALDRMENNKCAQNKPNNTEPTSKTKAT